MLRQSESNGLGVLTVSASHAVGGPVLACLDNTSSCCTEDAEQRSVADTIQSGPVCTCSFGVGRDAEAGGVALAEVHVRT